MKILILGSTGKVGRELAERLKSHTLSLPTRSQIDRSTFDRYDVVINATAMNGMEACHADPTSAYYVNGDLPCQFAKLCDANQLFVHYSSDYAVGGHNERTDETTLPRPCGIYGISKLAGEQGVLALPGNNVVMRVSSVYGRAYEGPCDAVKQMLRGHGTPDNPVKVLRQWCAPTSARLIADATAHVIETVKRECWKDIRGLYNFATSEPVWKIDFARHIVKRVLEEDCVIEEGQLALPRPVRTFLSSEKFSQYFTYPIPDWQSDFEQTYTL